MSIPAQLKPGDRVRVVVYRDGIYKRSFYGRMTSWSKSGLANIVEDEKRESHGYSTDNVRVIHPQPQPV